MERLKPQVPWVRQRIRGRPKRQRTRVRPKRQRTRGRPNANEPEGGPNANEPESVKKEETNPSNPKPDPPKTAISKDISD